MTRKIEVSYDGDYPNACSGKLEIKVDGELIYSKKHCCSSTGSVSFDDDWNENVTQGELNWEDANDFAEDLEILRAVYSVLDGVGVCCGGCV